MTDEISATGTGERGTFKIERPKADTTRVNREVLAKEVERGTWWRNPKTERIERFRQQRKPLTTAVHFDSIPETEAIIGDGRKFDSRSARDRYYREQGYSSLSKEELRQEWAKQAREKAEREKHNPREHAEHWEAAEQDIKYGKVELTEWEKEVCRRENQALEEWKKGSRSDAMALKMRDSEPTVTIRKD